MEKLMDRDFHFEINCFEDFVSFIAIIRGKEIDLDEIKKLTSQINKDDKTLQTAINKNKGV